MGKDHRVHLLRIETKVVAQVVVFLKRLHAFTLEHATIQQNPFAIHLYEMLGSGDLLGGAETGDFHIFLSA
jgi:hypothetical protein